jgi:hypothetical protein
MNDAVYENAGNNIADGQFKENVFGMQCPDPTHLRKTS